jgi:hypothetical protein
MFGVRRPGRTQCKRVLAALWEAEQDRLVLTDQQLCSVLSGQLSRHTVHQAIRLLDRSGLLTRGPSRTAISQTHLWVERRLSLTACGRAAAACAANVEVR